MADNHKTDQIRTFCAILFADIAGYSAIMESDEQKAAAILTSFKLELSKLVSSFNGKIINFYGDGALCIFSTPLEAIRCSISLQTKFISSPSIPVRIGIHSGTVVYEGDHVFGDSINVTSRIESMGVPGAVLFSKKVMDDIKNQKDIQSISLGTFDFKNITEPLEIFALANDTLVVPKRELMQGKLKATQTQKGRNGKIKSILKILSILILLMAAGLFALKYLGNFSDFRKGNEEWNYSIVVLPFENLGHQDNEEYFFDGIADEIRAQLSVVQHLKVISRSSSMVFKNANSSTQTISKKLNVSHILSGTIQRRAETIKISLELINTNSDALIWSMPAVERKLNNIFAIQTEIAQSVVRQLKLELSSQEKELQAKKTEQPSKVEAYEYFLRGKYIYHMEYQVSGKEADFNRARQLLSTAIALDSQYVSAYGLLADLHDAHGFLYNYGDTSIWKKDFRTRDSLISIGYGIDPENPYVLLAKGWSFVEPLEGVVGPNHSNMDSAFLLFKKILDKEPDDPFINMTMGNFLGFNQGLFQQAVSHYENALKLDPLREDLFVFMISMTLRSGDWIKAEKFLHMAENIINDLDEFNLYSGFLHAKNGNMDLARIKLQELEGHQFGFWDNQILFARLHTLTGQKNEAYEIYKSAGEKLHMLLIDGKLKEVLELLSDRINNSASLWYDDLLNDESFDELRSHPTFLKILEDARQDHFRKLERFNA